MRLIQILWLHFSISKRAIYLPWRKKIYWLWKTLTGESWKKKTLLFLVLLLKVAKQKFPCCPVTKNSEFSSNLRSYIYAECSQLIHPATSKGISWGLNVIGVEQGIYLHLCDICALLFNSDILNNFPWKVWLIERDIRNQAFKKISCSGPIPQLFSQNGTPKFST